MTGYRSRHFRHECTRSGCYIAQLPSWDDLIECFPRGIRPTDVDGLVEINGHVLVMEEKAAGKSPDNGQRLALRSLSRLPLVTLLYIRPGRASEMEMNVIDGERVTGFCACTREELRQFLREWVSLAELPNARSA